jgi:hypothetical protein
MFPIVSQKGEVIAFGGRVLGAGEPKYLNSPETPLFEKGRELFGLPQARTAYVTGNGDRRRGLHGRHCARTTRGRQRDSDARHGHYPMHVQKLSASGRPRRVLL